MLPNGLFSHLYSPIEGCHNNTFTLAESSLMDECILHTKLLCIPSKTDTSRESHYLQLFGNPAYRLNRQIISPFLKQGLTDDQQEWNMWMLKVRIEVKHCFALVIKIGSSLRWSESTVSSNPQLGGTIVWVCCSQMHSHAFSPIKSISILIVLYHLLKITSMIN